MDIFSSLNIREEICALWVYLLTTSYRHVKREYGTVSVCIKRIQITRACFLGNTRNLPYLDNLGTNFAVERTFRLSQSQLEWATALTCCHNMIRGRQLTGQKSELHTSLTCLQLLPTTTVE